MINKYNKMSKIDYDTYLEFVKYVSETNTLLQ